ncbi:autorepressor SdpR family transcription factor [Anaeromassilibacillus sp. SJQ-5]
MGFAETFKALGDPVRRAILELLREGERPAGDIAARFDLTGATVSYHLAQLKKAGLVAETRRGTYLYYQLNASVVEEAMLWLAGLTAGAGEEEAHDQA